METEADELVDKIAKKGNGVLLNEKVTFGKHAGKPWASVPIDYLKWLHNEDSQWKQVVEAEYARRGAILSKEVEISAHAIDRASLRLLKSFERRNDKQQGLYSWLSSVFMEGWAKHPEVEGQDRLDYKQIRFLVKWGSDYPVITSVYFIHH